MTKSEAIKTLNRMVDDNGLYKEKLTDHEINAIYMGIKSLESERILYPVQEDNYERD